MFEKIAKNFAVTAICFLIAVLSIKVLSGVLTSPETKFNKTCIEAYDEKIGTTMKLTATAAGAAALISVAPGDVGTPIANELAEISKYFLIVLSALYFEKYFIVIAGFVVSYLAIPLACICGGLYAWTKKRVFQSIAIKSILFGAILALIVPCTVVTSNLVANAYNETLESAQEFDVQEEKEEDKDGGILNQLKSTGTEVVTRAADYLTNLLEALAVMLVVSCLIPIIVLIIAFFVLKMLFTQTPSVMQGDKPFVNKEA